MAQGNPVLRSVVPRVTEKLGLAEPLSGGMPRIDAHRQRSRELDARAQALALRGRAADETFVVFDLVTQMPQRGGAASGTIHDQAPTRAGNVLQQGLIELATANQYRTERNEGQLTVERPRLQLRQLDIPIRDLSRQLIRVVAGQVQRVSAVSAICVASSILLSFRGAVDVRMFDIELWHVDTDPRSP